MAPYHLRLDWLMWFEAMAPSPQSDWFFNLLAKLLQGDRRHAEPVANESVPERRRRATSARRYYRYRFTTPDERRATGAWWNRQFVGTFYGPVSLAAR